MKSADCCSKQYKYQLKGVLLLLFSVVIMINLNLNVCFVHLLQEPQQLVLLSVSPKNFFPLNGQQIWSCFFLFFTLALFTHT